MMTKWFSADSAYFFKINKAAIEKSSVCPITVTGALNVNTLDNDDNEWYKRPHGQCANILWEVIFIPAFTDKRKINNTKLCKSMPAHLMQNTNWWIQKNG